MPRLPPKPDLRWTDDGAPIAADVDDVYFSRDGGLDETRAVFLGGCGLPEAWRGRPAFVVGELGFGAGLNALALWDLWRRARAPGGVLHFVSIEARLMDAADAARALSPFAEIAPLARRLLDVWPERAAAPQRRWFPDDGFCLTLHQGKAHEIAPRLAGRVDAWFLDGFAPARNADMWSPEVLRAVAAASRPGARLATYTVAAAVREGLTEAGFTVAKRPGYGRKRERLEAVLERPPGPDAPASAQGPVAVVGAGIAGAACAAALTRRGRGVLLLDAGARAAGGASGNPIGLVSPRLDRGGGGAARLFLAAYLEALSTYRVLGRDVFDPVGVIETAKGERERAGFADLLADPPLPARLLAAHGAGVAHPSAGVLRPAWAVEAMLAGVETRFGVGVAALERAGAVWRIKDAGGRTLVEAASVVLATGPGLSSMPETAWLPIAAARGQIDWALWAGPAPQPVHARSGGTYAAPYGEHLMFGATFDPWPDPQVAPVPDDASSARNRAGLAALEPAWADRLGEAAGRRACLRATTPDRLPIAGPAPDARALTQGRANGALPAIAAHPGLYLLGGLGSRGLTFAPLLGETLASFIVGDPPPLDREMAAAIDPARFLLRRLRRERK